MTGEPRHCDSLRTLPSVTGTITEVSVAATLGWLLALRLAALPLASREREVEEGVWLRGVVVEGEGGVLKLGELERERARLLCRSLP